MTTKSTLSEIWNNLDPVTQRFVEKVLAIEEEKLHLEKPRHVNDEILKELEGLINDI